MSALPAYSLLLGLIALLGFMAIAAGVKPLPGAKEGRRQQHGGAAAVRPAVPGWFAGIAFAAIGIGALVPAAIMSIAAANLFTRNIYKEYLKRDATPAQEAERLQDHLAGGQGRRGRLHRLPRPAVLHRPAAHRRRDHPADAAGGGAGPLHPVVPPRRPDRRLGRRHGAGHVDALPDPQRRDRPRSTSAARRSRWRSSASIDSEDDRYVGLVAVAVNLRSRRWSRWSCGPARCPTAATTPTPDDYFADEGDPRVSVPAQPPPPTPTSTRSRHPRPLDRRAPPYRLSMYR